MGLISMIAAPVMPQTRPCVSVAAAAHGVVQPASEPPPVWPVSPSASSAALVRDHWRDANSPRPLEAEGVELDGIPFVGDEAILLDDLPQEDPAAQAKPGRDNAALPAAAWRAADPEQTPDHRLTEAATRAYEDERAISGLHPIETAQTEAATDADTSVAGPSNTGPENSGPENRPRR